MSGRRVSRTARACPAPIGVTTQSVEALLDAVDVRGGSRLLDVATGAGHIAGAAARRGAHAIGLDVSPAQLRMARERYPAVRFEQGDAAALPFDPRCFDAVVNGFGMCDFPDPDGALREAFRVLKPGGRVAFTVWEVPERTTVFGAMRAAIRAHGSMDVGLPPGAGLFPLSGFEQSRKTLLDAGFVSPCCSPLRQVWRVSDPDSVLERLMAGSARAAAAIRAQSPAAREAIRAAVRDAVAACRRDDSYEVPLAGALATAVKPWRMASARST